MRKFLFFSVLLTLLAVQAWAQRTVTGRVTDDRNNPLPNVSVQVKGTNVGTITKDDGTYSINVPANGRALVFSFTDMGTQELTIGTQGEVNARLSSNQRSLDEVVVVGYGSVRRRDQTASVSTINAKAIKDQPVQSFEQALAGKATGLNVTIPNGVLNNPPVVRIRGANSITGSTFPLIVIDGVPTFSGDISTNLSANNVLGNINPSDIESIEVLKDAAAAAIYGSRAANGVMLITTKKGKGKPRVSYETWVGWTRPFNTFDVLNADQYVALKNEAVRNNPNVLVTGTPAGDPLFFLDTIGGRKVDTRWSDYIFQTGFQQNHTVSVAGASQGTRYYFSANYSDQDGILQTNSFDRRQVRMNLEQRVNNWFKVGGNFNFSRGTTRSPNSGSLPGTPFATAGSARLAFVTAPNVSPYLADGRYNIMGIDDPVVRNSLNQIGRNRNKINSGFVNPVLVRDLNIITSQNDQLLGDVNGEITIIKGLTFNTKYGVNYQTVDDRTFYNSLHGDGIQTTATTDDGRAFNTIGKYNITTFQNYLTYDFKVRDRHSITLLAGSEEQTTKIDRWGASRSGLTDQFFNDFQGNFTINDNPVNNALTENYLLSFFGRANYSFNNRYIFSATVRRDGYSAFAEGKKWGTFAGASAGWNISDESFFQGSGISRTLNLLRLRGSYGEVGNIAGVGNFAALSTFSSGQYGLGYPTLFFSQAGNQDLTWETSKKLDVGIQFGLFNDRVTGEATYYRTNLSDLIIDVPTPTSMGIPGNTIAANAATMYNRGFEVSLNGKVLSKKNFNWDMTVNVTTQKNEVTSLAPGVPEIVGTTQLERTNITRVGSPIGSFFVVRTGGVDAATGQRIFLDKDGKEVLFDFGRAPAQRWRYRDGSVAPAIDLGRDGVIAGNALPTVYGGFINNFSFRGFDLNVDMIYSFGNKVYFGSRAGLLDQRFWNNSTEVLERWQKPGDVTDIPRVVYGDNFSNGSAVPLDINLFDGGFVKCRNISLGYTLPNKLSNRAGISNVRIYTQVFNAFTITNYPGSDPEISVNGNTALTPGVDRNTVGQARTFTLGINVGF